jgi:3-dehydroquinate dehydratase-2
MLGKREPNLYGSTTLADIEKQMQQAWAIIDFFQTNSEANLIEKIHNSKNIDFIIINPAAWTHTSVAIRDALLSVNIPFIEVHLSNIFTRESFRHKSYLSDIAFAVISGLGAYGYTAAMNAAKHYIEQPII